MARRTDIIDLTKLKPNLDNSPLVSVIVPSYNVEEYIDQCLTSILNNCYQNIELLVIDDRSTDCTVDHIKALMKKDKRIQLFHNPEDHNIYGGACRNIGLDNAKGKYVYFCDSDDYILPGLISECVRKCEKLNADICCFKYEMQDIKSGITSIPSSLNLKHLDESSQIFNWKEVDNVFRISYGEIWDKFYSRDFIESIHARFQEQKHSNDTAFFINTTAHASRITFLDKVFYVYRFGTGTSVQKWFRAGNDSILAVNAVRHAYGCVKDINSEKLISQFRGWLCDWCEWFASKCNPSKEAMAELKGFLKNLNLKVGCVDKFNTEQYDVVVSFATHGRRMLSEEIYKFLESIVHQKCSLKYHIVANVWKRDYENIPWKLAKYFNENQIEVLVSDFNWKPNLKYIMSMQKYHDIPVITVDDDWVYRDDMVQLLYDDFRRHPRAIISGKCRKIQRDQRGKVIEFEKWPLVDNFNVQMDIMPIGYGATLYPPEFCQLVDMTVWGTQVIKLDLTTKDDFYLHYMAQTYDIKSKLVEPPPSEQRNPNVGVLVQRGLGLSSDNTALWRKNLNEGENNKSLSLFDAMMPDLVVSLTSYPHRFMQPDFLSVLKSLRNQKTNVNYQIVLSLFKDDISKIPLEIREYIQNNEIQILACDEDIKAHKKYFYVMQRYASVPVITVDDDVVYRNNLVEDMYGTYLENKGYVVCGRCCKMLRDGTGKILPTDKWNTWQNTHDIPPGSKDKDLFGVGCGGILYPPEFCREIKPYLLEVMEVVEPDDFLLYMIAKKIGLKYMVANTLNVYKKSSLGLFGDYSNDCARDKFALWQQNRTTKVDDKCVGYLNQYKSLDGLVRDLVK